jgi:preprotein translocase subunit SecA
MREEVNAGLITTYIPPKAYADQWDLEGLDKEIFRIYGVHAPVSDWAAEEGIADQEIAERLGDVTRDQMAQKEVKYRPELMRMAEKRVLLTTLDQLWKDHLLTLDHLRHGINLRAYGQRDPLNEYRREAFDLFEEMLVRVRETVTGTLSQVEFQMEQVPDELLLQQGEMHEGREDPAMAEAGAMGHAADGDVLVQAPVRSRAPAGALNPEDPTTWGKVPRNAPCPCGSGRKYKHCHGQI